MRTIVVVGEPLHPQRADPLPWETLGSCDYRYLNSFGYDEIAINVHYLSEMIEARLGDGSEFGVRLEYSHEPELLGSAGGVKQVQRFFGDQDFVVVGCDDLTDLPLDGLLEMHRAKKAIATIGLVEREHPGLVRPEQLHRLGE